MKKLPAILSQALQQRATLLGEGHNEVIRLFNGFYEGHPQLVADLYAETLVLFAFADEGNNPEKLLNVAREFYVSALPAIHCVVEKEHRSRDGILRKGKITYGNQPNTIIREHGICYTVDVQLHQDTGFYPDTRNLRKWLLQNAAGKSVLNTFAYTGSLGVAALAGGAARVIQLDRNRKYLEFGHLSARLNHLDLGKMKLVSEDFFTGIGRLKKQRALFDLVLLDPPFFSITDKGRVNQVEESARLINKIRPLVADGGRIVAINNSLFLSGAEYMVELEELTKDGYLSIEERIPVPPDISGYLTTVIRGAPADPTPFNHPTKIVVLAVKRKGSDTRLTMAKETL